jgi:thymidylate synthase
LVCSLFAFKTSLILDFTVTKIYREEAGYMELLRDVLDYGIDTPDRTGLGRRKIFAPILTFDLRTGFPLFSARSTPLRFAFEEFWAFINGVCHIGPHLRDRGIHIWDAHTSREFLDSRKLYDLPEGHLGKGYGFQFRAYNGEYDFKNNPRGGVDQILNIDKSLRTDRYGSRHTVTILNPSQQDEMALHPCWHSHQFLVVPGKDRDTLNLRVDSRSADLLFGTPFNCTQYASYLLAFACMLDMEPGELTCMLTDGHLYGTGGAHDGDQIKYARELLTREFSDDKPWLFIKKPLHSIQDLLSLQYADFSIQGHDLNRAEMETKKPKISV